MRVKYIRRAKDEGNSYRFIVTLQLRNLAKVVQKKTRFIGFDNEMIGMV